MILHGSFVVDMFELILNKFSKYCILLAILYGFVCFYPVYGDTITAYCKHKCCCGASADGITYSGRNVDWGMVAADPRIYPMGTILLIDGFRKPFVVEDIGGMIKGNHLDIFFPDEMGGHVAALSFGKQERLVKVLRWGTRRYYAQK